MFVEQASPVKNSASTDEVLAPGPKHARPSARSPIGASGNFPAHVSAELISPNFPVFRSKYGYLGGWGVTLLFFSLVSQYLCYLGAHTNFRIPMISLSGIYLKLAHFPLKIGLIGFSEMFH